MRAPSVAGRPRNGKGHEIWFAPPVWGGRTIRAVAPEGRRAVWIMVGAMAAAIPLCFLVALLPAWLAIPVLLVGLALCLVAVPLWFIRIAVRHAGDPAADR